MKTILLVDSDLGFMFWLGQSLDSAGYEALPAKSVSDAIALVALHQLSISLLMVNASLEDADGLVQTLRNSHSNLKVVGIGTGEPGATLSEVDVWHSKPDTIDEAAKLAWLDLTKTVLSDTDEAQYRIASVNPE